jgi:elongation factor Tu
MVDDKDMIDLVEEEIREILTKQGFDKDCPVIRGSGLKALEATSTTIHGHKKFLNLQMLLILTSQFQNVMLTKPFLMPIEDIFSIEGRGTVVTGRIERGVVKVGEEIEIVGIKDTVKDNSYWYRNVQQKLKEGMAGDNAGILLRGVKERRPHSWTSSCKDRFSYSSHRIRM